MKSEDKLPGAVKNGGDDATEAGGGNLHRGRGATAWGREEWRRRRDRGRRGQPPQGTGSHCLGPRRMEATTRQRPAGATSTGDGEPLSGAEKIRNQDWRGQQDEESRPRGVVIKTTGCRREQTPWWPRQGLSRTEGDGIGRAQ